MKAEAAGRSESFLLVLALACLALALWRLGGLPGQPRVEATGTGQPILVVQDERDAGAKEAEPTIYVLWPGQKKIEAYCDRMSTFVTYDFASSKVIYRDTDIEITSSRAGHGMAGLR